jgi:hypothetical protein
MRSVALVAPLALRLILMSVFAAAVAFAQSPTAAEQPSATASPRHPDSSYRSSEEQTDLSGSITNRGTSSVNAVVTPLGRYQKLVYDAIGTRWYGYLAKKPDMVGLVRISFWVDRSGKPKNLRVSLLDANEVFANLCLQSILEVKLPPIPEDVASALPPNGLKEEITFKKFRN